MWQSLEHLQGEVDSGPVPLGFGEFTEIYTSTQSLRMKAIFLLHSTLWNYLYLRAYAHTSSTKAVQSRTYYICQAIFVAHLSARAMCKNIVALKWGSLYSNCQNENENPLSKDNIV